MLHRSLQHLTLCQVFHRAEQNTKQFCSKRWKKFAAKKQAPPKSEHAYDSICVCFFVVNGVNVETAIPVRTFNICQGQDVSERNLDAGEFQSLLHYHRTISHQRAMPMPTRLSKVSMIQSCSMLRGQFCQQLRVVGVALAEDQTGECVVSILNFCIEINDIRYTVIH